MSAIQVGIWAETRILLRNSFQLVRAGGARLLGVILASQLIILGVALPVLGWLFREALRANGMHGLDLGGLQISRGIPLTMALIFAIVLIAFWFLALQFTAIVVLLRWPEVSARQFGSELWRVVQRLARPSSFPLISYLFLLMPLTGFGFTSAFTRGIAIPAFISGELLKGITSAAILAVVLLVLIWLNLRLSLTIPVFVLTTGGPPVRSSWRMTRGPRSWAPIALSGATLLVLGALATAALSLAALAPTAIADVAVPGAAPAVAAVSLGVAQVLGMLLSGLLTATLAAVLITRVRQTAERLPAAVRLVPNPTAAPAVPLRSPAPRGSRRLALVVTAGAMVAATGFAAAGFGTLQRLSTAPETLILAHRGFSDGGVENTLTGLAAAADAGADFVEMDVMQTRDGGFVAMHDSNLERLAGRPEAVRDLTLAEITGIPVHDLHGNTGKIPAFRTYVERAQELGMPLLIEIKLGGADTPDHVEQLIAELESVDALDGNMYHSLDPASVTRLKQLRPDLTVGYTMAFAGGGLPDTIADFVVVEEWTATDQMQQAARDAGLGFMAWTVNDEKGIREHLRRGSDGIITDHPDLALAARAGMQQETGLTVVLLDALTRFVTVM